MARPKIALISPSSSLHLSETVLKAVWVLNFCSPSYPQSESLTTLLGFKRAFIGFTFSVFPLHLGRFTKLIMVNDVIAPARRALQYYLTDGGFDANRVKESFQKIVPKDGVKSFGFLVTQEVLAELGYLLTRRYRKSAKPNKVAEPLDLTNSDHLLEITQSKEPSVVSATGRWSNDRPYYTNALTLIRMIDPEKGAIGPDFSEPLFELFRQKFSQGDFFGLETVQSLCHYSVTSSTQLKQLMKSILTSAEHWLRDNHWRNTNKALDFVRTLLDDSHHPEISQKLEEVQNLITHQSWLPIRPTEKDLSVLENLKQLEALIVKQESLHFALMESDEKSWRVEELQANNRGRTLKRRHRKW